jgi:predicted transcriptional regulator YdeE
MTATVVAREVTRVLFRSATDEQAAITEAWTELERAIGSLRGRRFYGAFDEATGEYRACVERRDDDDPLALGLEEGTLPGGHYARVRLHGEPPELYRQIAPAFERLAGRPDHDPSRPSLELYKRHDTIELLLPVRATVRE